MKIVFLLSLLALLPIFGTAFAASSGINIDPADIGKDCHPACFEFVPTHASQSGHQVIDLTKNQDFTVIMADGSCNIDGIFNQATNTCSAHSIVLTPDNFKTWQTDVASMYVGNIFSTDTPQNVDYCTLAAWSWQHQTPEFQAKYDITQVIPSSCFPPNVVPEFPVGLAVFGLVFGGVIALGRMVDGHWIWQ